MSDIARRHHYLPVFYLAGFTPTGRRNDYLQIYDRDQNIIRRARPKNEGAERDFNAVEIVGLRPDVIEQGLSDFEDQTANIIREIARTKSIPMGDDLVNLLNYSKKYGCKV